MRWGVLFPDGHAAAMSLRIRATMEASDPMSAVAHPFSSPAPPVFSAEDAALKEMQLVTGGRCFPYEWLTFLFSRYILAHAD